MTRTRGARGLAMAEALVAVAVLAIATTIALALWDACRAIHRRGQNLAESQQAVRAAFDRLVAEMRLAGFHCDPDGDATRPDEGLEAAYDTALVLRADFDLGDPTAALEPEIALAAGRFDTVSTGNDEIVAWVLAKPDGSAPDTLRFEADVLEAARDGDVEIVAVDDVALVHDDPPYTLYRVTLNADGTGPRTVRTPVIDNVRALSFRYYDRAGAPLNRAFDLTSVADDIGGGDADVSRNLRAAVRRIEVRLEGMTDDPDPGWFDRGSRDPVAAAHPRYVLVGSVVTRNLGLAAPR